MDLTPLPLGVGLDRYQQQVEALLDAYRAGDEEVVRLLRDQSGEADTSSAEASTADAALALARWYHFENWPTLAQWVSTVALTDSEVAQFEWAIEAIVAGDVDTLMQLLKANPALVKQQSMREHRATLLIYVGANGVEGYRQKTPKNAVEVAKILLDAGAEIDYVGKMYRGTTTLGLVATSVWPVITGVQEELMQFLLDRGASLERAVAPDYTEGLVVNACLANGRPDAAVFLAARGARLDLEGAAGVGRLDIVKAYFNDDGTLKSTATQTQLKSALKWACNGRTNVVEFLLSKDIKVGELHRGETPLHMAAYGGCADIVKLLLERSAPVDAKDDTYGSTPLGWALHGWTHRSADSHCAQFDETVALLRAAGSVVAPAWLDDEQIRANPRILAALTAPR